MTSKKTRTMYMHTLDGIPARAIYWTQGRVSMVKVTKHVRIPLHATLAAIRGEQADCMRDQVGVLARDIPATDREEFRQAVTDYCARFGYVRVAVSEPPAERA